MTLALLIGVPLALIVAYGFWMGGELGLDSERRVPGGPYGRLER